MEKLGLASQPARLCAELARYIFGQLPGVQLFILRGRVGDNFASDKLLDFYARSIRAINDSIENAVDRRQCLSEMTGYFGASMACLEGRYASVADVRKQHLGKTDGLQKILLLLLANYQHLRDMLTLMALVTYNEEHVANDDVMMTIGRAELYFTFQAINMQLDDVLERLGNENWLGATSHALQ